MKMRVGWWLCEICGESRGRGRDHSRCSKLIQAKHKGDMAQPHADGVLVGVTKQHQLNASYKARAKRYKQEKGDWPE